MKRTLFILTYFLLIEQFTGQVGIGTTQPDPSAALDIVSNSKGLKLPVVNLSSTEDLSTVPTPIKGFLVYNTSDSGIGITSVTKGLYTFDGNKWNKLLSHSNAETKILQIPFLNPIFIASNILDAPPPTQNADTTVLLTFNKLGHNYSNGATGTSPTYDGYTIQENGVYSISFTADIRNSSGDNDGEQVLFVRKNDTNLCAYGMQRKFQFGGISNDCTSVLSAGDVISFTVRSSGSSYQIYNTNVSIYQSH